MSKGGAAGGIRTLDQLITNQLLYQAELPRHTAGYDGGNQVCDGSDDGAAMLKQIGPKDSANGDRLGVALRELRHHRRPA